MNNSGVYEFSSIEDVTEEKFHKMFDINVLGLLLTTKAAVEAYRRGGSTHQCRLYRSRVTPPASSIYTGTKGAVDAITGVLARELRPKKIRVNAISGMVDTEGVRSAGFLGTTEKALVAQTPLGRIGQPGDIASVAVFLASDDSGATPGEHLLAGGGLR